MRPCVRSVVLLLLLSWSVCGEQKKKGEHKRRGVLESSGELGKDLVHVDRCLDVGKCLWLSADDSHRHERDGGVVRGGLPPHTTALGLVHWVAVVNHRQRQTLPLHALPSRNERFFVVVVVVELVFVRRTRVGVRIFLDEGGSGKGVPKVDVGVPKTEVAPRGVVLEMEMERRLINGGVSFN
jgi:hypothetical protein